MDTELQPDPQLDVGLAAWGLEVVEPASFIVAVPGDVTPTPQHLAARLGESRGDAPMEIRTLAPPSSEIRAMVQVSSEVLPSPLLVWLEPARPPAPGEVLDPAIGACRWVVGMELQLDPLHPIEACAAALRLIADAWPDAVAILDVNCGTWRDGARVRALVGDDAVPAPPELLWVVRIERGTGDGCWVRTLGLNRCACPELEMLEVPEGRIDAAAAVLTTAAGLLIETHPRPRPGQALELGPDLPAVLQRWQDVAPTVAADAPGTPADRSSRGTPAASAVLCAPQPVGRFRPLWVHPGELLDRVGQQGAMLYSPLATIERTRRLARATWPRLLQALRTRDADPAAFTALARAAVDDDDDEPNAGRTHLWYRLESVEGDLVQAAPLEPPSAEQRPDPARRVHLSVEVISDWQVLLPGHPPIGPEQVEALPSATGTDRDR
jgi:hypothetical protein